MGIAGNCFIDSNGNVWLWNTLTGTNLWGPTCISERIASDELELTEDDRAMLQGMKIRVDGAAD